MIFQAWDSSLVLFHILVILVFVIFVIVASIAVRDLGVGNVVIVLPDGLLLLDGLASAPFLRQDIARHGEITDVGVFLVADSYWCDVFSECVLASACGLQPRRARDALWEVRENGVILLRCTYPGAWLRFRSAAGCVRR